MKQNKIRVRNEYYERSKLEHCNTDTKGLSKVSKLEKCQYWRGHYDDVTSKFPLTVFSVS